MDSITSGSYDQAIREAASTVTGLKNVFVEDINELTHILRQRCLQRGKYVWSAMMSLKRECDSHDRPIEAALAQLQPSPLISSFMQLKPMDAIVMYEDAMRSAMRGEELSEEQRKCLGNKKLTDFEFANQDWPFLFELMTSESPVFPTLKPLTIQPLSPELLLNYDKLFSSTPSPLIGLNTQACVLRFRNHDCALI